MPDIYPIKDIKNFLLSVLLSDNEFYNDFTRFLASINALHPSIDPCIPLKRTLPYPDASLISDCGLYNNRDWQGAEDTLPARRPDSLSIKPQSKYVDAGINSLSFRLGASTTSYGGAGECEDIFFEVENSFPNGHFQTTFDLNLSSDFVNPTEKKPMSIAECYSYLNLGPIFDIFEERYGKLDYHYRYPLGAMFKACLLRRISNRRSFQKLVNRLEVQHQDAKWLGFKQEMFFL